MTKILTIFSHNFLINKLIAIDLPSFSNKVNLFTKIPQRLKNPYYHVV
ncbi:hypothetical protein EU91_0485 [Prochlorococcus marinus str. GP2]|uniref:Uncharacterized protein n=1 Tax=Prochlorococcus marinus str. GP2 TaxID=59925 RepID=A0A0A1ZG83_PROMR|nr:hypothetical protein EU91_0485 [Prochlorococcus marinus str. GP2]